MSNQNPITIETAKPQKTTNAGDDHAARELFLFATNDGDLYRQTIWPVIENVADHIARRRFDSEKAARSWERVADEAARAYHREFGTPGDNWYSIFPPAVRRAIVPDLAESYEETIAEKAAHIVGPRALVVSAFNFSRDTNGNPTAHYSVDAVTVTKRRKQIGYDETAMGGARDAIKKADHRPEWYKIDRDSITGDRANVQGVNVMFYRPAIRLPDGTEY
jgi:hypothetical protein